MICPECGAEYREGFETCSDCGVPLAVAPPDPHRDPEPLETVLETSDVAALPVVKSLLESAGIPYETVGEGLVNTFPALGLGTISPRHTGEVKVLVPVHLAADARALLEGDPAIASAGEAPSDEARADEDA